MSKNYIHIDNVKNDQILLIIAYNLQVSSLEDIELIKININKKK